MVVPMLDITGQAFSDLATGCSSSISAARPSGRWDSNSAANAIETMHTSVSHALELTIARLSLHSPGPYYLYGSCSPLIYYTLRLSICPKLQAQPSCSITCPPLLLIRRTSAASIILRFMSHCSQSDLLRAEHPLHHLHSAREDRPSC